MGDKVYSKSHPRLTNLEKFDRHKSKDTLLRMKRKRRKFDRDFVRSEIMTNAMDTTEEYHRARAPKRPKCRDFQKRNYRKLGNILSSNRKLYKKIMSYKSEYRKELSEHDYI